MDRIDKPLDVAIRLLGDNPESTPLEITLKLAAAIPVVAIADSLHEHFLNRNRFERIQQALLVFKSEIEALDKECAGDREKLGAMRDYLRSPELAEAILATAEEAARSTNMKKIERLGLALANSCDSTIEPSSSDDLTSFIRDLSQLSEGDVQALRQLTSLAPLAWAFAQGSQKSSQPEPPFQSIINDAEREKLLTDDFYSHCFRLVGFGLAAQIPGNSPGLVTNGLLFRLTRRGHRLAALLKKRTNGDE
jgi:hypothetical protein